MWVPESYSEVAHMSDILWGAVAIGREANIIDENGEVDIRRLYYMLDKGYLPAKKIGRAWISSTTAIRSALEVRNDETLSKV
jgi:hypothetical protein